MARRDNSVSVRELYRSRSCPADIGLFQHELKSRLPVLALDLACLVSVTTVGFKKLKYRLNEFLLGQLRHWASDDCNIMIFSREDYINGCTNEARYYANTLDVIMDELVEETGCENFLKIKTDHTAAEFVRDACEWLDVGCEPLIVICDDQGLVDDLQKMDVIAMRPRYRYGDVDMGDKKDFSAMAWKQYILGIDIDDTLIHLHESIRQGKIVFNQTVVNYIKELIATGSVVYACLITSRFDPQHVKQLYEDLAGDYPGSQIFIDQIAFYQKIIEGPYDAVKIQEALQQLLPELKLLPNCHSNEAYIDDESVVLEPVTAKAKYLCKIAGQWRLPIVLLDNNKREVSFVKTRAPMISWPMAAVSIHEDASLSVPEQIKLIQSATTPDKVAPIKEARF